MSIFQALTTTAFSNYNVTGSYYANRNSDNGTANSVAGKQSSENATSKFSSKDILEISGEGKSISKLSGTYNPRSNTLTDASKSEQKDFRSNRFDAESGSIEGTPGGFEGVPEGFEGRPEGFEGVPEGFEGGLGNRGAEPGGARPGGPPPGARPNGTETKSTEDTSNVSVAEDSESEDTSESEEAAEESSVVADNELTEEEQEKVDELKAKDAEVRQREALAFAKRHSQGNVQYTYETGPDGKQYAVDVSISDANAVGGVHNAAAKGQDQSSASANEFDAIRNRFANFFATSNYVNFTLSSNARSANTGINVFA
jgi:hypothetical protein